MTALDSPTAPAPAAPHESARTPAAWALQILLTAAVVFAGVRQLLGLPEEVVENVARTGLGEWVRYFVGVVAVR